MREEWWERPTCWLCDYWWLLLLLLVLGLGGYFSRDLWRPLLGIHPEPTPTNTPQPTATSQPTVPSTPTPTIVLGTGDVQITLDWNSRNDLDLWVIDPAGSIIYFGSPSSPSGGRLDVDANSNCNNTTATPVENIFWPPGQAPRGAYRVEAHYYRQCVANAAITYHVRLLVDGKVSEYDNVIQSQDERQTVIEFTR